MQEEQRYPQTSDHESLDFDALFRSQHRGLAKFIAVRVSDPEQVKDIAAEAFLECMQYCRTSDAVIENPRALLFTIARRCVIRYYGDRQRTFREVPMDDAEAEVVAPGSIASDVDARAEIEHVRRAMDLLRVEYREILILHGVVGMTVREIADITGKQTGTIRVLLFRARRALRRMLGGLDTHRTHEPVPETQPS